MVLLCKTVQSKGAPETLIEQISRQRVLERSEHDSLRPRPFGLEPVEESADGLALEVLLGSAEIARDGEPMAEPQSADVLFGAVHERPYDDQPSSLATSFGGMAASCPANIRFNRRVCRTSSRWCPRAILLYPRSLARR